MKEKSVKLNMFLNLIRTLMGVIYPLITFPYVSRILNPEGIGKVDFTNSTVSLFFMIAGLGITTYAMREGAKIRDDEKALSIFVSEVFCINALSTLISYILFFTLIWTVPKYESYLFLLYISCITIGSNLFSFEYVYTATEDYLFITLRSVLFQVLAVLAMFLFVKTEDDFGKYLAIGVFSNAGSHLLSFACVWKKIKPVKIHIKNILKHLKPIFILFGVSLASSVYQILDQNMLGLLSTDYDVGIYNAAIKVIHLSIPLMCSLTTVLIPRLSYYAEQDLERYFQMLKKSVNLMLFISIPSTAGIFILAKPIILIICGDKFLDSVFVMQLMSPIVFFMLCGALFADQIFVVLRKDKLNFYPVIAGACINCLLNFILIPKLGAIGAAIGTLVAETSVSIIRLILARPYTKGHHYFSDFWKYLVGTIIMFFSVYFLKILITRPILQILIGIPFGVLVYFICLAIMKSEIIFYLLDFVSNKLNHKHNNMKHNNMVNDNANNSNKGSMEE